MGRVCLGTAYASRAGLFFENTGSEAELIGQSVSRDLDSGRRCFEEAELLLRVGQLAVAFGPEKRQWLSAYRIGSCRFRGERSTRLCSGSKYPAGLRSDLESSISQPQVRHMPVGLTLASSAGPNRVTFQ